MKQSLIKLFFILLVVGAIFSCSSDDGPVPLGAYENGVIIVNEGNFSDGDASVSFYNQATSDVELNIFDGLNGRALGDVAQSAEAYDTLLMLVVNNSNKVEVVNRYTMKGHYSIEAALPRYAVMKDDIAYISEWVSFSDPGRVSVVDITTGSITESITVGYGAEDLAMVGNKLYVSNSFENTISVIDLSDNSVKSLELSSGPAQMIVDASDKLWVACKGGFDAEWNPANDGAIYRINTQSDQVEATYNLNANFSGKLAANGNMDQVYFYVGNAVFSMATSSEAIPSEPVILNTDVTSFYGIGVDPQTSDIYLSDSKGFLEDGETFIYNANGSLKSSFTVGRGPNGFVFN